MNEKIYEALCTLKQYCSSTHCDICALSIKDNEFNKCMISRNERGMPPKDWNLVAPKPYKAFDKEKI